MIKRINAYRVPDISQEELVLAEWAFDSHSWIESVPGVFKCEWCGRQHTYTMPVVAGYPLCSENQYVKNHVLQEKRRG